MSDLPAGWTRVELAEVADVVSGATPKTEEPTYWGGDIAWATPKDLSDQKSSTISTTDRTITQSGLESCASKILPPHSVLLSSRAPIGLITVNTVPLATNQGFKSLVPGSRLNPWYLAHWLRSNRQDLEARGSGATFKELSKRTVSRLQLPLPPLDEQRRIANILDHATALEHNQVATMNQLDNLVSATFNFMFGDPDSPESPWPTATLNDVSLNKGAYGASVSSTEFYGDRPRFIRITDITDSGTLNNDPKSPSGPPEKWRKHNLAPGDLLFARSGATVGKTYLYDPKDGPCVYAGYLIRFQLDPDKISWDYASHFTRTEAYWRWVRRTQKVVAQPNINAKQYGEELRIPLPPPELQNEFASRARWIQSQRQLSAEHLQGLRTLNRSLRSRAFRGEL